MYLTQVVRRCCEHTQLLTEDSFLPSTKVGAIVIYLARSSLIDDVVKIVVMYDKCKTMVMCTNHEKK